jgi:hypothetical protein
MKQHIKQFFKFLEEKEDKRAPLRVKLLNPKDFNLSPEELNVKGNLDLRRTQITSLPDNLTVERNLWLDNTPIKSLPDNLTVEGNLDLTETQIQSLPRNLKVKAWIFLSYTPLAEKYTKEQIRSMIEEKGGTVDKVGIYYAED